MSSFSIIQRIRNKIKIKGENNLIILEDKHNTNIVDSNIYIKGNNNTLHIKKNVRIKKVNFQIKGDNCQIIIGNNCILGYYCHLVADGHNTILTIDDDSMLSRNAKVMTSDGHFIYDVNGNCINQNQSIYIGKKVWLADNVTILKGISIGDNSIVGINSTLTKSIPNNVIAAGNPARIIKENITWEH